MLHNSNTAFKMIHKNFGKGACPRRFIISVQNDNIFITNNVKLDDYRISYRINRAMLYFD